MKARRPVAFLVACWFAFFSVWTPRQAFAFAPVAVLAAPQIVSAGGTAYLLTVASLSALVGVVGMYLEIEDAQENAIRIPLGSNANNEPPEPSAPSTAAMEGGLVVPGDKTCGRAYSGSTSYGFTELCTLCMNNWGQYPGKICVRIDDLDIYYDEVNTQGTCPDGYSNSGGTCTLSNARRATDDKTCDILLSSGQFATADDMNCPATVDGTKLAPMIRDGKTIAYGRNSNGDPIMWEVTPGTSKYTLKQSVQTSTATQTQVQTTTVEVDAVTSEITSVSTNTSPGSLASPSASSVPTSTDPQTQPTTSENTPTVQTQDGQVIPEFKFPDDYAREPTVKEIRDALTQQSTPPADPTAKTESEIGDQFFKTTFDSLKGWTLPGHSSQCPTGSFDAFGSTHVIDAHCTLINNHWGVLQAAMLVVWSIAALWIVLRA